MEAQPNRRFKIKTMDGKLTDFELDSDGNTFIFNRKISTVIYMHLLLSLYPKFILICFMTKTNIQFY